MKRVLLTGAAGDIGGRLRKLLKPVYPELRLSDIKRPADLGNDEPFIAADLARLEEVEKAVEADWPTILQANIAGCYNLFEAARRQGVRRVVFASTNHVVGFYPRATRIDHQVPPRPDSRYGVSKAFGEALGRFYADKFGLGVMCIRIGNFGERLGFVLRAVAEAIGIGVVPPAAIALRGAVDHLVVQVGMLQPDAHQLAEVARADPDRQPAPVGGPVGEVADPDAQHAQPVLVGVEPALRPAPAVDLDQPTRLPPAGPDRARASRPAFRDRLRRLGERPHLVGQRQRLSPGLPAAGRVGDVRARDPGRRDGADGPRCRAVPGRPVLLGRVHR